MIDLVKLRKITCHFQHLIHQEWGTQTSLTKNRRTRVSTAKSPREPRRFIGAKSKNSINSCFRVRSIKINNQNKEITSDFESTFQREVINAPRVKTSKARKRSNRLSLDSNKKGKKGVIKAIFFPMIYY